MLSNLNIAAYHSTKSTCGDCVTHVTSTLGDVPFTLSVLKSELRSWTLLMRWAIPAANNSADASPARHNKQLPITKSPCARQQCAHQSILRNTAGRRSGLRYLASDKLEPARWRVRRKALWFKKHSRSKKRSGSAKGARGKTCSNPGRGMTQLQLCRVCDMWMVLQGWSKQSGTPCGGMITMSHPMA